MNKSRNTSATVLDRNHDTPLYEQAREHLREFCLTSEPNTPLAPVREMCESLGLNHNTLTRALRDLEADGLLRIIPRKGTFVTPAPRATVELLMMLGDPDSPGPVGQMFVEGMEDARNNGETITATTIAAPPYPDPKRFAELLRLRRIAALAVSNHGYRDVPGSLDEANFIYSLSRQVPLILLGKPHALLDLDCVYTDARPQLTQWMQNCYDKGVRRFGYITTKSNAVHYQERYEAFRQFHLDHGLQWSPELIPVALDGTEDEVQREKTLKLLDVDPLPEAIVATFPASAYLLILEAHRRGLTPGQDIHILCFAGYRSIVQAVEPYASTILLHEDEVGRCAMRRIEERLKGIGNPEPYVWRLPATLREPLQFLN